jgi:hypothetical protein
LCYFFDKFALTEEVFRYDAITENWNALHQVSIIGKFMLTDGHQYGIPISRCLGAVYDIHYVSWGTSGKKYNELRTTYHYNEQ